VAVNCSVAPRPTLGVAGVIATDVTVSVAAVTVSAAVPLTLPTVAVIVLEPAAMLVANPAALIVATDTVPLVQVAVAVTDPVDPSL
jgi:hypothetical protein